MPKSPLTANSTGTTTEMSLGTANGGQPSSNEGAEILANASVVPDVVETLATIVKVAG